MFVYSVGTSDNLRETVVKFEDNKGFLYYFIKRLIDIVGSVLGLLILSPLFLIMAILIKIDSKGPVFYTHDRVGKNGKIFKMIKFRSMVVNADDIKSELLEKNEMNGPMFKIKDDPRITKIGKFMRRTSIDELPQLLNVLKGEMTIVGPRPSLPQEVEQFEPWMMERLNVSQGLTCYWQVMGRNDIDFLEWMELDLKYVRERSTLLDIKLILKTVTVLFGDEHAR